MDYLSDHIITLNENANDNQVHIHGDNVEPSMLFNLHDSDDHIDDKELMWTDESADTQFAMDYLADHIIDLNENVQNSDEINPNLQYSSTEVAHNIGGGDSLKFSSGRKQVRFLKQFEKDGNKNKEKSDSITKTVVSEMEDYTVFPPLVRVPHDRIGMDSNLPFQPRDMRNLLWEIKKRSIAYPQDRTDRAQKYVQLIRSAQESGNNVKLFEYEFPNGQGPMEYNNNILFRRNLNGCIVDFNGAQTMALRNNSSVNLLGSKEQAKSAYFYIIDYFCKDGTKLQNSLTAAAAAVRLNSKYPGKDFERHQHLWETKKIEKQTQLIAQQIADDEKRKDDLIPNNIGIINEGIPYNI
jgi:hypothetical protein